MTEKFSKILKIPGKIKRVDGFDPTVLNVMALTPNEIRVQALIPGVTTLVITDENKKIYTIETFVSGDARHLQAYLRELFPTSSVTAIKVQDSVVLRGLGNRTRSHYRNGRNRRTVLSQWCSQSNEAGGSSAGSAESEDNGSSAIQDSATGGKLAVSKSIRICLQYPRLTGADYWNYCSLWWSTGITASQNLISGTSLGFGLVNGSSIFQAFIEALKQEALLKILAEPELVTTSGRPANLLSGGEFPILVPQSLGTVTIEWREFGVRMEAVPIVLGNGRLRLEVQPEVSERDFSNAVQVSGTTVPGLTVRRANTAVEMNFGETMVIAGLISSRKTAETSKTPFLGELPFVGAAFRRVKYSEGETELVIMVTPELVSPLKSGQVPPGGPGLFTTTPTDKELYSDGVLEVPNYGSECPDCRYSIPGPITPESMLHSGNTLPPVSDSQLPSAPAAPSVQSEVIRQPSLSPAELKNLKEIQKIKRVPSSKGAKVPNLASPPAGKWKTKQSAPGTQQKTKGSTSSGKTSNNRPGLIAPGT